MDIIKNKCKNISLLFWLGAIFSYYFQFPFSFLSKFIVPFLFLFLIFELKNYRILKNKKYIMSLVVYFVFIFLSLIISVYSQGDITRSFRFFLILVSIVISTFVKRDNFELYEKSFLYLSVAKSVLLICIAIYLLMVGDHTVIRSWISTYGFGDIYLLNGIPKVQVQGNALLVVAFFVNYMKFGQTKFDYKSILLLLGVLSAGNFAFILALILFFGYRICNIIVNNYKLIISNKKRLSIYIIISLLSLIILVPYVSNKIKEKSVVSNRTRIEQATVLLDTNIITGNGLGHYIKETTSTRTYDGDIYFELQSLYIYNQIGLFGIGLFYLISIYPFLHVNRSKLIVYLIYLCYTFWNPYCFDTTQIITIIVLYNGMNTGEKNEEDNYYSLLSYTRKP